MHGHNLSVTISYITTSLLRDSKYFCHVDVIRMFFADSELLFLWTVHAWVGLVKKHCKKVLINFHFVSSVCHALRRTKIYLQQFYSSVWLSLGPFAFFFFLLLFSWLESLGTSFFSDLLLWNACKCKEDFEIKTCFLCVSWLPNAVMSRRSFFW